MKVLTLLLLLSVAILELMADSPEFVNRRTLGFSVQQGLPLTLLPENKRYALTGLTANFHQPFFKPKKTFINIGLDLTPQLWIAYAHRAGVEAGLNASLNINFQVSSRSVLAFHIGSGFHYFGMTTDRQARGFIFADNFLATYRHLIRQKNGKDRSLGFVTGYRHISNLRIKQPNKGINNFILGICFDRIY